MGVPLAVLGLMIAVGTEVVVLEARGSGPAKAKGRATRQARSVVTALIVKMVWGKLQKHQTRFRRCCSNIRANPGAEKPATVASC